MHLLAVAAANDSELISGAHHRCLPSAGDTSVLWPLTRLMMISLLGSESARQTSETRFRLLLSILLSATAALVDGDME